MNALLLFADLTESVKEMADGDPMQRLSTRDTMLALAVAGGLVLVLVVWTFIIRRGQGEKDRRARRFGHGVTTTPSRPAENGDSTGKRRRRRRRRPHRPRNPSLQQTGGLPPPRPDDQPPKN